MSLRIFIFLLFIPILCKSQERNINLSLHEVTLVTVMDSITAQTGLRFSFNSRKIDTSKPVSIVITDGTLNEVLRRLTESIGYQFVPIEDHIVIKDVPKSNLKNESLFTISGFLSDSLNGEALIGATVLISELAKGTISNLYGFYSLTVPPGEYSLIFSFVGYKKTTIPVVLTSNVEQNIEFTVDGGVLPELIIEGTKPREIDEIQTSMTYVEKKEIQELPSLMGELDVIKALQSLPGVKMYADGSTFFSVRGGAKDQNLILLDESPIYNPSHLLGFFSSIVPEAINDMTLYKGDLPSAYGGRVSSLLNIQANSGNLKNFSFWGSLGLMSAKIGIEAPFKKDHSSFFLSARRSYVNWVFDAANGQQDNLDKLQFYDITGKVNLKLNQRNKLFLTFYTSNDEFQEGNSGISWQNTTGSIRWNHLFSDRLFANTTVYASSYDYFLNVDVIEGTSWNAHVDNLNAKVDFSWFLKPENVINFGLGVGGYTFDPGNIIDRDGTSIDPIVSHKNSAETILYAENEIKITPKVGVRYGLRFTRWSNIGEAFEFTFDEEGRPIEFFEYPKGEKYNSYNNLAPRLNVSYFPKRDVSLKASYNRTIQNLHLITNSISPFTTLDVWLPSSTNIKPQQADIISLGITKAWNSGISIGAEGFYKLLKNQIDYKDHALLLLNPFYEGQLLFGDAKASGVEFTLRKDQGRIRGWAGYTYTRVKHQFDKINNGQIFPGFFDRPNEINLVGSYDISLRIQLGLNWIYTTGAPFSSPTGFFYHDNQELPIYGQKHNDRYPNYHRLDLSANFILNKNITRFQHSIGLSIYNAYANKNPTFVNFNKIQVENGDFKVPGNLFTAYRLSTEIFYYRIVPSVSYRFKFQ